MRWGGEDKIIIMKKMTIKPRAVAPATWGEAMPAGTASRVLNLRESADGLSLEVMGLPRELGTVPAASRLLHVLPTGSLLASYGRQLLLDGRPVYTFAAGVAALHAFAVGDLVVVATTGGTLLLGDDGEGGLAALDPADAVPSLAIGERAVTGATASLDAYTFAEPYSRWQTVDAADAAALAAATRKAWRAATAAVTAVGHRHGAVAARVALRLQDDTYLWVSRPVTLSDTAAANAARETVRDVTRNETSFTGVEDARLTVDAFVPTVTAAGGVAPRWRAMVKAVDLLVSLDEVDLADVDGDVALRCVTSTSSGTRTYSLVASLAPRPAEAVTARLAVSAMRVVATCADLESLAEWTPVTAGDVYTVAALDAVSLDHLSRPLVDAMCHNGCYCALGTDGSLTLSPPANAPVAAAMRRVTGVEPLALLPVTRPLFWGGAGRYFAFVFTRDGIYAVSQSAAGTLGEPRLVSRTVIDGTVHPVEGERGVYFVTAGGELRLLAGQTMRTLLRGVPSGASLAPVDATGELWVAADDGAVTVVMPGGRTAERDLSVRHFLCRAGRALAVTTDDKVLDTADERPVDAVPVEWTSHPVALGDEMTITRVASVQWSVNSRGRAATLRLSLEARRALAGDWVEVAAVGVDGTIDESVVAPVMMVPQRVVRLRVTGTAPSSTLLLPSQFTIHNS